MATEFFSGSIATVVIIVILIVVFIIFIVIIRADMDTFPTPGLLGFWPEGVLLNNLYGTNFNLLRCSISSSFRIRW